MIQKTDYEVALCGVTIRVTDYKTGEVLGIYEIEDYKTVKESIESIKKTLKENGYE
jgi:hypothetical protein